MIRERASRKSAKRSIAASNINNRNATLVRASLDALLPLVRSFEVAQVGELAQLLGGAVRALRRVGLRDDAIAILEAVAKLARGDAVPSLVISSMNSRTASDPAARGRTHWYWVKPRGP